MPKNEKALEEEIAGVFKKSQEIDAKEKEVHGDEAAERAPLTSDHDNSLLTTITFPD